MTIEATQTAAQTTCYSRGVVGPNIFRPFPNPVFEWATCYLNRGLSVVPVPYQAKRPIIKEWQNLNISAENLGTYFNARQQNIGVLLGEQSGWLVDIDLDSPPAVRLADYFLPKTAAIFGRKGKPSSHRLYRCEGAKLAKFNDPLMAASKSEGDRKNACIAEIRVGESGKGIQTVFPPSVHESGEHIEWVTNGEPLKIEFVELETAVKRVAAASLLVRFWRVGVRHDLALAVAGTLLRYGRTKDEVIHFVKAICRVAGDEELDDRLRAVEDTLNTIKNNGKACGIPRLVELTDPRIVDSICKWLKIGNDLKVSEASKPAQDRFKAVCMKDVEAKEVEWLWKPFIPAGEFTILEGAEGIGKSWIGCALACAVASGSKLPFHDTEAPEPANVLILSAEDSLSHTVRPRLESMGADLSRIFAIDEVFSLNDTSDLLCFEAEIARYNPKLVFIDPMFSYTSGKDLNAESSSRPIARKLIALTHKYGCTIIGVRHIGKSKGNGDARNAGLGSISWRASARSVVLVGQDPDTGERAICQTKSNLAEQSLISVGFEIVDGQFLFCGKPSSLSKERMLSQVSDPDKKAENHEAIAVLREVLRSGEKPSKEVAKDMRDVGVSDYAFRKAKSALGVTSFKKGGTFGGEKQQWYLRMPGPAEVVDIREFQHLQENHSNKASYDNGLPEDVETNVNRHDQQDHSTSSNGRNQNVRQRAVCDCGEPGYVGYDCRDCGETVQGD